MCLQSSLCVLFWRTISPRGSIKNMLCKNSAIIYIPVDIVHTYIAFANILPTTMFCCIYHPILSKAAKFSSLETFLFFVFILEFFLSFLYIFCTVNWCVIIKNCIVKGSNWMYIVIAFFIFYRIHLKWKCCLVPDFILPRDGSHANKTRTKKWFLIHDILPFRLPCDFLLTSRSCYLINCNKRFIFF